MACNNRHMLTRLLTLMMIIGLTGFTSAMAHGAELNSELENEIIITGSVIDADTGEPVAGANVTVRGRVVGVPTGADGTFRLRVSGNPPITLAITMVGYETREIEITESSVSDLVIELREQVFLGRDVVVSASRVEESILEAPVSIEKMDIIAVNQTASDNYYKSIANLKGVDVTTSSINFQIINSRGFNSTGNTRMVQLIDGMDTQAPALNFPIGNLNGPSELDVESVEYIPGASSALYGPNAFNGILLINSKSPFRYQGLSVMLKSGMNHFDGNQGLGEPGSPQFLYDTSIRYADALTDRLAFKVNFSYNQADDWNGIDFTDKNADLRPDGFPAGSNPAYDGVHLYGDDGSFNIGLLGFSDDFIAALSAATGLPQSQAELYAQAIPAQPVNRTGYREKYLVDYGAENLKINTSIHYRLSDLVEASYTLNYGYGTSIYTGAQRYSLNNFNITQHKLELQGDNFLVKAYGTFEDSGDSYIADFTGFAINEAYRPNTQWFGTYGATFAGALVQAVQAQTGSAAYNENVVNAILNDTNAVLNIHSAARAAADQGRYEPGTQAFEDAKEASLQNVIPNGALFDDNSRFYHAEGQYNFKNEIDFIDLQAGLSFRQFQLRSNGTIFDDADGGVNINEWGAFMQASRDLFGRAQLTGSIRYDKNENFDGQFSPRISTVIRVADQHNIRASFQTGFRNPTTQGQYIDLDVITARLLGGLPRFADKYDITTRTYTMDSVQRFTNAFLADPDNPIAAIGELERYSVHNPVKPEQIKSFEVGYKGLFGNRLFFDGAYYYNIYDDFITQIRVRRAADQIPNPAGIASLLSGDSNNTYQVYTNIDETVTSHGAAVGFELSLPQSYLMEFNYNFNELIDGVEEGFLNDFNTPKHKVNFSLGNRRVTDNLGFKLTYRWQDEFLWQSTFTTAQVPAVSTLDAQVTYRIPNLQTVVKFGGSNVLNNRHVLSGGGPNLGAIYYVSLTYDQIFRR